MAENAEYEKFISTWTKRLQEIKKQPISWSESIGFVYSFEAEKVTLRMDQPTMPVHDYFHKFQVLRGELFLARKIANANYRKQNPSSLNKILEVLDNVLAIIRRTIGG